MVPSVPKLRLTHVGPHPPQPRASRAARRRTLIAKHTANALKDHIKTSSMNRLFLLQSRQARV